MKQSPKKNKIAKVASKVKVESSDESEEESEEDGEGKSAKEGAKDENGEEDGEEDDEKDGDGEEDEEEMDMDTEEEKAPAPAGKGKEKAKRSEDKERPVQKTVAGIKNKGKGKEMSEEEEESPEDREEKVRFKVREEGLSSPLTTQSTVVVDPESQETQFVPSQFILNTVPSTQSSDYGDAEMDELVKDIPDQMLLSSRTSSLTQADSTSIDPKSRQASLPPEPLDVGERPAYITKSSRVGESSHFVRPAAQRPRPMRGVVASLTSSSSSRSTV